MIRRVTLLTAAALLATAGAAGAIAFARADTDKDGLVTYSELDFVMPKLQEVSFKRFDTNKDGFIDQGEWSGLDAFYRFSYQQRN